MTDPNKPTTVVTQPAAGGQQVLTTVLPHGTKPVSVAEVAAANPQSANALQHATHMLDPLLSIVGGAANPAMKAMQSAISHRGAEAAVETPQMPTTLKEHGKMTFVDAPKQHVTAQFEAPAAPLAKTASAGHKNQPSQHSAAEQPGAATPKATPEAAPKAGEMHPKQQAAPVAAEQGSAAHNGGTKRKHPAAPMVPTATAPPAGADKDKGVVPAGAGGGGSDKAAPESVDAAVAATPSGTAERRCCRVGSAHACCLPYPRAGAGAEENERAAKSTHR